MTRIFPTVYLPHQTGADHFAQQDIVVRPGEDRQELGQPGPRRWGRYRTWCAGAGIGRLVLELAVDLRQFCSNLFLPRRESRQEFIMSREVAPLATHAVFSTDKLERQLVKSAKLSERAPDGAFRTPGVVRGFPRAVLLAT